MNNSKIAFDIMVSPPEVTENITVKLREREAELVRIIDAIGRVTGHSDWAALREEVFSGLLQGFERQLKIESEKESIDTAKMYRLQGKIEVAKKYLDLNLAQYKKELQGVRLQLTK